MADATPVSASLESGWQNADLSKQKTTFASFANLGAAAKADDFRVKIDDITDDIGLLIQGFQIPEMKRELVETYGPHGVKIQQQGKFLNSGDIQLTFREVVTGKVLAALKAWCTGRLYKKVILTVTPEDEVDNTLTVDMEHCWFEMDPSDMSVEDGTQQLKPTGTLHYNWVGWDTASTTAG